MLSRLHLIVLGLVLLTLTMLSLSTVHAQNSKWTAESYNNPNLQGAHVLTQGESSIDYSWNLGAPVAQVGADNFSIRWLKVVTFTRGIYRFTLAGDDGVRLFIDNVLTINQWKDEPFTAYTADVLLSAGSHTLRVEYFEHTGEARVQFSYVRKHRHYAYHKYVYRSVVWAVFQQ